MAGKRDGDDFYFEGFDNPNTTPVPDVVFDRFLSKLGEAELKALLYIIRRTLGFKKNHDPISFNQFLRGIVTRDGRVLDEGCGIRSRTTLSTALKALEQKGIVTSEKGRDERGENDTTVYTLRFKTSPVENSEQGVVRIAYHRSTESAPPVVRLSYPQETGSQETVEQQTDQFSNKRTRPYLHKATDLSQRNDKLRSRSFVDNSGSRVAADAGVDRPAAPTGMASVGEVLAQRLPLRTAPSGRNGSGASRGRPPKAPPYIAAVMGDISGRLHDDNPRSSLTRATRLWKTSGLAEERFVQEALYPARSRTQQQGGVTKRASAGDGTINRVPYFFAVVEDLLGHQGRGGGGAASHNAP